MNDLIVHSDNFEADVYNLSTVLDKASKFGLKINWNECRFLQTKTEYLGPIIKGERISPSENKIKAVASFPTPTCVEQVQSFLGLSGYFRKYTSEFSVITRLLHKLAVKGVKFEFGVEEQNVFLPLKKRLCNSLVLKLYRLRAKTEHIQTY